MQVSPNSQTSVEEGALTGEIARIDCAADSVDTFICGWRTSSRTRNDRSVIGSFSSSSSLMFDIDRLRPQRKQARGDGGVKD